MKQFIDKLISRLKKERVGQFNPYCDGLNMAIKIVKELAEEHKDDIQTIDVSELLGESVNDGWIACSGCKDCMHKECEHYGKV